MEAAAGEVLTGKLPDELATLVRTVFLTSPQRWDATTTLPALRWRGNTTRVAPHSCMDDFQNQTCAMQIQGGKAGWNRQCADQSLPPPKAANLGPGIFSSFSLPSLLTLG